MRKIKLFNIILLFILSITLCSCDINDYIGGNTNDNQNINQRYDTMNITELFDFYVKQGGKANKDDFLLALNYTDYALIYVGDENPDDLKCSDKDKYVNIKTWHYYQKVTGKWNFIVDLMSIESDDGGSDDTGKDEDKKEGIVNLDFYSINDFHGTVLEADGVAGITKTSTYLKNQNEENPILISTGDMWQGSSESNNTKGKLVTEWMNDLKFASMTVGNHEFDWSSEYVKTNSELAQFPMLAINVYDRNTNEKVNYCDSSTIIERDGAKIGIIGAIGDCYSSISSSMVQDVKFIVGKELTNLIKEESNRLRNEEECDFIVYAVHDGIENYDIELSDGYVDLVFEGHTHQNYIEQDAKGIYHLQTSGYNRRIGYVDIDLDLKTNEFKVNQINTIYTSDFMSLEEDAYAKGLFEKYSSEIGDVHKVLGYNSKYRKASELKQVVADLYLKKGLEKWEDEYDIVLGGGYLNTRNPYDLEAGDVTYSMLQTLMPFDNNLVLCKVSGSKLLSQFINTSNNNYYISYSDYGKAIKDNIVSSETYYIVVDTYSSDYSYNGLTVVDIYDKSGYYARDMLAEYIKEGNFGEKTEVEFNHLGTLEDPYDVADAIVLANQAGGKNNPKYGYFKVYVSDISTIKLGSSGDLGNFYVEDENGNTMYVYYLSKYKNSSSSNNWSGVNELKVGDELIIYGVVYLYNGNPQFGSGNYCVYINGK